MNNWKVSAIQV